MKRFFSAFIVFLLLSASCTKNLYCLPQNQSLQNEAGFITIEPVDFYFFYQNYFSRLALRSSEARIWYSFQRADQNCQEKPLFVFFNGGPGGATSSGLFSLNTSRKTLNTALENGGEKFIANPVSWTQLGNLLYIDARTAGFSYNLMNSPQDADARYREFDAQNFNVFIDAADFIRVLLEFLSSHPGLQNNPVVIVGESYGGIRSNVLFHILLNYKDFGNGKEMYQDNNLVEKIQEHYDTVFPGYVNSTVPPGIIAKQFGHQILIQPAISAGYQSQVAGEMFEQEGSVIFQIAEEEGLQYIPCRQKHLPEGACNPRSNALEFVDKIAKRDYYNYTKPKDWFWGIFYNAARLLCFTDNLSMVTGMDVTGIPFLYASARTNAYKIYREANPDVETIEPYPFEKSILKDAARLEAKLRDQEPGDMTAVFGLLQPWDRYFLSLNYDANDAFHWNVALYRGYDVNFYSPRCGRMFLKNVAHVNTFITNAAYDLVVYARAIPGSLECHSDILESVVHNTGEPAGVERPGRIALKYKPDVFPGIKNLHTRAIRFPFYATSSHAVSINQPVELFNDVSTWLKNTGLAGSD